MVIFREYNYIVYKYTVDMVLIKLYIALVYLINYLKIKKILCI